MPRKRSATHAAGSTPRPARRIHEETPGKLPEIAGCPDCGASYREGRWTWKAPPAGSYEHVCPACERIGSNHPAGMVDLVGAFVEAHRDDLLGLLRNVEKRERDEHPLKRIMAITDQEQGIRVTTTDAKLAASLGRALKKAHEGQLDQPGTTSDTGNLVRVRWSRD